MVRRDVTIREADEPALQVLACGIRGTVRDWLTGADRWETVVVDRIQGLAATEGLRVAVTVVQASECSSELVRWIDALRANEIGAPIVVAAHQPSARFMRTALGLHVRTVVPDERLDLLAAAIERAALRTSHEPGQWRTIGKAGLWTMRTLGSTV